MAVPLLDLRRDIRAHREEYLSIAARVLDSGRFTLGPEIEAFEQAFAEYLGVKHVVSVNNGTSALYAAFLALGIGPGDEVIVPANSFVATAEAVLMAGAKPVFIDIDASNHILDFAKLDNLVGPKTKAVAIVHLFGYMADVDALVSWAKPRGIRVVEDTAQAQGARWTDGRFAGTVGDIGCFSFYPTKCLGAFGEAGAIVTNDDALADHLRAIRFHGTRGVQYQHEVFGTNLKMNAFQAGFLRAKLSWLEDTLLRRREIAKRYQEAFANLPMELPPCVSERHAFYVYTIATDQRDALQVHLQSRGIGCGVYYPILIPDQSAYKEYAKGATYPVAVQDVKRILSIPMFPEMTDEEVIEVIGAVKAFIQ